MQSATFHINIYVKEQLRVLCDKIHSVLKLKEKCVTVVSDPGFRSKTKRSNELREYTADRFPHTAELKMGAFAGTSQI